MCNRRAHLILIGLAVLVGGMIGVLVTGALREHEPTYAGKRLSEWVMELPPNTSPDGDSEAEKAIRHIGTNSLAYLLKWISYEPAPWRLKLYETAGKFLRKGPNVLFQDKKMLRAASAAKAFGALGREADPATEALNRMVNDRQPGMRRVYAFFALGSHGGSRNINVTVYCGADAFSLTYRTNGVPVLTVSHTNAAAAVAASLPAMP